MKRIAVGSAVAGMIALGAIGSASANLLTNGNLDTPGVHESDVATGWTLIEGPPLANAATFALFADHTGAGGVGLWYRSFEGGLDPAGPSLVSAHLLQVVPGVVGQEYELSAWFRFEAFYSGGVTNLNAMGTDASDPSDGPPSSTQTYLALEFLDAADALLPGSVVLDLRTTAQTNGGDWLQHTISAVAPGDTVNIQVRASMVDGLLNPGVNPQSAFVDDFTLLASGSSVPEPSSSALLLIALYGVGRLARRAG
jgi:hypothetical protein